ncbi:MAG: hypothetical protein E7433_01730 [Ruminococcaceae bacterium]|nr:hypothetical protein [Oscillospiraceae bacterium]
MELNRVELALKEIYDGWQLGNECENNGYSAMFRMGYPDEYIDSGRPLLMYVGQEDLNGNKGKTQEWIRKYQTIQRAENNELDPDEKVRYSPFWVLYRTFCDMGYNSLWNNLDKLLKLAKKETKPLEREAAVAFNAPYGEEGISVLQREINLLKPKVIVFAIGPREKYRASLASAFSIDVSLLYPYRPTRQNCVNDISSLLGLKDTIVLWTYHPNYLSRGKLKDEATQKFRKLLSIK